MKLAFDRTVCYIIGEFRIKVFARDILLYSGPILSRGMDFLSPLICPYVYSFSYSHGSFDLHINEYLVSLSLTLQRSHFYLFFIMQLKFIYILHPYNGNINSLMMSMVDGGKPKFCHTDVADGAAAYGRSIEL